MAKAYAPSLRTFLTPPPRTPAPFGSLVTAGFVRFLESCGLVSFLRAVLISLPISLALIGRPGLSSLYAGWPLYFTRTSPPALRFLLPLPLTVPLIPESGWPASNLIASPTVTRSIEPLNISPLSFLIWTLFPSIFTTLPLTPVPPLLAWPIWTVSPTFASPNLPFAFNRPFALFRVSESLWLPSIRERLSTTFFLALLA